MNRVALQQISLEYGSNTVLQGVSLTVAAGEIVTLIGPNGSGKSSLVRIALGLIKPTSGEVMRRPGLKIGYVPQQLAIDPSLPLSVEYFMRLWGGASSEAVIGMLRMTGIDHLLEMPMQGLSGGEKRRVLLARAMLFEPDLLVLDEPTAGMDVNGQADLYRMVESYRLKNGCAVLLVSHDLHLVMAATDRVICLNRHICCAGRPEEVSRHPEYLTLFGREDAAQLAVYPHHHDHQHDLAGRVQEAGRSRRG